MYHNKLIFKTFSKEANQRFVHPFFSFRTLIQVEVFNCVSKGTKHLSWDGDNSFYIEA